MPRINQSALNLHFIEKEDYEKGFSSYFDENIKPLLKESDAERTQWLDRVKKKKRFALIGLTIVTSLSLLLALMFEELRFSIMFAAAVAAAIIIVTAMEINFRVRVINRIIPPVIRFFGDFKYRNERCLDREELRKSSSFDIFNYVTGKNYVEGRYMGHRIKFSEVLLSHYTEYSDATIFQGIAIIIKLDNPYNGRTVVRPKRKKNLWNTFYNKLKGMKEVALERPEYQEKNECYSTYPEEVTRLVTPPLLRALKAMEKVYPDGQVRCSFFEDKLLLALSNVEWKLFEPGPVYEKSMDADDVRKCLAQMHAILEVIDTAIKALNSSGHHH